MARGSGPRLAAIVPGKLELYPHTGSAGSTLVAAVAARKPRPRPLTRSAWLMFKIRKIKNKLKIRRRLKKDAAAAANVTHEVIGLVSLERVCKNIQGLCRRCARDEHLGCQHGQHVCAARPPWCRPRSPPEFLRSQPPAGQPLRGSWRCWYAISIERSASALHLAVF
ncbi:hypothetical protein FVEG_11592 [Fusarium verticillioides 7600]|uniref:Uncharacterized protein n=1 Tax=Gibberella moniliformis (strain M3125 / FGSC 7600) TaxID=334819 RepID=W7MZ56_GIBM7|nr:hypothetical protein FVEG_11592 [Fusarium verticillioides 7600]EWG53095.1 hypothetical protein FVEG_11592 [Fusarium verticillioides 7600]